MNIEMRLLRLFAFAVAVASAVAAKASVPPLLNYQGVLKDTAGEFVPDGNYSVTFRIWDSENGGTALWSEGRLVTVQDGLFTVLLGSITAIPNDLFEEPDRWLGLQVGLDAELSPRSKLVSSAYSYHALIADRADTADEALAMDTAGYSAYADLVSEGRIGIAPGQLAPGDSIHPPVIVSTGIYRVEDTSTVTFSTIVPGTYLLKQIDIPAGEVGHFMQIRGCMRLTSGEGVSFSIWLNGQFVWGGFSDDPVFDIQILRVRASDWNVGVLEFDPPGYSTNAQLNNVLAPFAQVSIELRGNKQTTNAGTTIFGALQVVYDKD